MEKTKAPYKIDYTEKQSTAVWSQLCKNEDDARKVFNAIKETCMLNKVGSAKLIKMQEDVEEVIDEVPFPTEDETSLEIDEVEPVSNSIPEILKAAYFANLAANDIKYIHLNCFGSSFDRIHEITDDYYNKLSEDFDLLAEISLEDKDIVLSNPSTILSEVDWQPLEKTNRFDYVSSIINIEKVLKTYRDQLEKAYAEVHHDIQSELDSLIRYWNKELQFKNIRRQEFER